MKVQLDRLIYIDKLVATQDATYGSATQSWKLHVTAWAERRDGLPSRSEVIRQGLEQGRLQTRFRMRWHSDVDASMRIRDGDETFQIVGGPSEIGRREYLEIMAEKHSTTGGAGTASLGA